MRLVEIGSERKRMCVMLQCFPMAAQKLQRLAEVVMSLRIGGIKLKGRLEAANRLVISTERVEAVSKVVVGLGKPRPERHGSLVAFDRCREAFQGIERVAEVVVRFSIAAL